ncbi:diaminopimelate aminotransferase [Betaproteobacteria bacterium]|nr:diaminopimelate aminotransferase [Betaproteobacteria bacterium]
MIQPVFRLRIALAVLVSCLVASSAWGASLLARQEKPDRASRALERVLGDLDEQRASVIAIQRELVARPAISPYDGGEGEQAKALWIEGWLREKRLPQAERIDVPDDRVPARLRPNLIVRYPGASSGSENAGRTLWIVSHLDVSPPGPLENWTASPWVLRVDGDMIYGRGVGDKHQAIVSALLLMESLARNEARPPLSLGLVLTSGEKTDLPPKYGISEVLRSRRDIFRPGDLIVVNAYGNAQGTLIDVAEKDILWLRITVNGRQTYSFAPNLGKNALEAGAALIMDLRGLSKRFPAENALFAPPVSTFAVTRPESEEMSVNQIPGTFIFHLDCRLLPGYTTDAVEADVRQLADAAEKRDGVSIRIERIHERGGASVPTSPDAPVVRALARAVYAQFRREAKPVGMGGVSQAFSLRAAGLPVAVWTIMGDSWAMADERIPISAQIDAAKIFARILFDPEARETAPLP